LKNYTAELLVKIDDFFPNLNPRLYKVLIARKKFDVKKMDSKTYMSLMYLTQVSKEGKIFILYFL